MIIVCPLFTFSFYPCYIIRKYSIFIVRLSFVTDGLKNNKSTMSAAIPVSRWKCILNSIAKQVSQVCKQFFALASVFNCHTQIYPYIFSNEVIYYINSPCVCIIITLNQRDKSRPITFGSKG